ncbi:PIG-L deacetylase family protein, partial [Streptomyces sp. NPDC057675]|uniref:PIG-L deacetylase family protein n=1 Tax=Streptomyces sp. NPDC057675 TaxID=3346204 RepID=UPI003676839C
MIRLGSGRLDRVVAVGAHCDDIAIGAGGTLLTMCRARPGIRVDALVLSGGGGADTGDSEGGSTTVSSNDDPGENVVIGFSGPQAGHGWMGAISQFATETAAQYE